MMGLLGVWRELSKLIGQNLRDWATWAEANPEAAALLLDAIAELREHRARVRRWKWLRRRDLATAQACRDQAATLREHADDAERRAAVCSIAPGTFGRT
jgi:hypothetical protein